MQKCSMDLSRNQTQNLVTMKRLCQTLCSALVFYLTNSVASLYYYLQRNRILNKNLFMACRCFSTPPVKRSATTLTMVRTASGPFCLKSLESTISVGLDGFAIRVLWPFKGKTSPQSQQVNMSNSINSAD